ncbi:hypothetical protein JKF63_03566 [Porcisia hertigi]|uniref:Uncharacterized protein n=1 Tax=Porcisia hertigi TaxID=2761500 RepID=A0A836IQX2_9TRYP|nr:hypothetical protein JKF63_03566 [Porcisia hertigi]
MLGAARAMQAVGSSLPRRRAALWSSRRTFGLHRTARCLKPTKTQGGMADAAQNVRDKASQPPPVSQAEEQPQGSKPKIDLSSLFYDTSVNDLALNKRNLTKDDDDGSFAFGQVPRGVMKREQVLKYVDMDELNRASELLEVPDAFTYPLHTMDNISEAIMRTMQSRVVMFKYASLDDFYTMRRYIGTDEDVMRASMPGNCIYFQFVHTGSVANSNVFVSPSSLANDHAKQQEVKAARDAVERILRRYVCRILEPFPNQLVIDVTHYATFLPLLNISRRNVDQVLKDIKDYIADKPVTKEGIAGPPSKEEIEPLTPDALAAEIARTIRREVLIQRPHSKSGCSSEEPTTAGSQETPSSMASIRVCIGVATTAVLAKIACDAEVAAVTTKLRDEEAASVTAVNGGTKSVVPLVSIRSFHRLINSLKASRDFMAKFPVARVPVFTPAFSNLLKRVFGIMTCNEFYEKRYLIYYCMSRETARVCHAAAFGRMYFEEEKITSLVALENLKRSVAPLEFLASNRISIVNKERTEYNLTMRSVVAGQLRRKLANTGCRITQIPYGRLSTEDSIHRTAETAMRSLHRTMHSRGFTYAGIRLTLFRRQLNPAIERFKEETTEDVAVAALHRLLTEVLPHRNRAEDPKEGHDSVRLITLAVFGVSPLPMVPPIMLQEATRVEKLYFTAKGFCLEHRSRMVKRQEKLAAGGGERKCGKKKKIAQVDTVFTV